MFPDMLGPCLRTNRHETMGRVGRGKSYVAF